MLNRRAFMGGLVGAAAAPSLPGVKAAPVLPIAWRYVPMSKKFKLLSEITGVSFDLTEELENEILCGRQA